MRDVVIIAARALLVGRGEVSEGLVSRCCRILPCAMATPGPGSATYCNVCTVWTGDGHLQRVLVPPEMVQKSWRSVGRRHNLSPEGRHLQRCPTFRRHTIRKSVVYIVDTRNMSTSPTRP